MLFDTPDHQTEQEPMADTPEFSDETSSENDATDVQDEQAVISPDAQAPLEAALPATDADDDDKETGEMIYATDRTEQTRPTIFHEEDSEEAETAASPVDHEANAEKLNAVLDQIVAKKPDPLQLKADIEAVLFITGKPLKLAEIAELVEADAEDVEMLIGELIQDFAFREGSGLEIDDTDGYIIQVREDCARIVHKMMPLELSAASIRTLSAIAIKAPILQSDLIELRGSTAYDHIGELLTKKLISKRRQGRSYVLNTTKAFDEYFKLNGDKKELEYLVNRLKPESNEQKAVPPAAFETELLSDEFSESA